MISTLYSFELQIMPKRRPSGGSTGVGFERWELDSILEAAIENKSCTRRFHLKIMQLQFVKPFEYAVSYDSVACVVFFCRRSTTNSINVSCAKAGVNAGNFLLNGIFLTGLKAGTARCLLTPISFSNDFVRKTFSFGCLFFHQPS